MMEKNFSINERENKVEEISKHKKLINSFEKLKIFIFHLIFFFTQVGDTLTKNIIMSLGEMMV